MGVLKVEEGSEIVNEVLVDRNRVSELIEDTSNELIGGTSDLDLVLNGEGCDIRAWDTVGEDNSVIVSLININIVSTGDFWLEGGGDICILEDEGAQRDRCAIWINDFNASGIGRGKRNSVVVNIDGLDVEREFVINSSASNLAVLGTLESNYEDVRRVGRFGNEVWLESDENLAVEHKSNLVWSSDWEGLVRSESNDELTKKLSWSDLVGDGGSIVILSKNY
jgi:hypothetical protein